MRPACGEGSCGRVAQAQQPGDLATACTGPHTCHKAWRGQRTLGKPADLRRSNGLQGPKEEDDEAEGMQLALLRLTHASTRPGGNDGELAPGPLGQCGLAGLPKEALYLSKPTDHPKVYQRWHQAERPPFGCPIYHCSKNGTTGPRSC